jgi:hypothetical protein
MTRAYCHRHEKDVQVDPPPWAPSVLYWPAIRTSLTGCPCADPAPVEFDMLWREIRPILNGLDDELATGAIPLRVRQVRGRPLSDLLDPDEFTRILRQSDPER